MEKEEMIEFRVWSAMTNLNAQLRHQAQTPMLLLSPNTRPIQEAAVTSQADHHIEEHGHRLSATH